MAEPRLQTDPGGPLRIVLFGLPGAGKSALLGALVQAASAQEQLLGTRLDAISPTLADLHKSVYAKAVAPTRDEIVAYSVQSAPLAGNAMLPAGEVVLIDCNGQAAAEILKQPDLDGRSSAAQLVHALSNPDTLLLVVDATDQTQLKSTFEQYGQFVNLLEETRGRRAEVTGLPVYLVLTKSDLLAKKTDTFSTWIQRLE